MDNIPAQNKGWITDATSASFNQDVVEASAEKLVLVDLWAPWCGPCKQLGPVLEKITNNAGGAISLVKIDIDQNPEIAQALRVKSIPAVFAFRNGQPVDGFMGAIPESKIKEFIEKNADGPIAPSPVEEALNAGVVALEEGDTEVALTAFAKILEIEPDHVEAKAYLSRVYVALEELEAARSLLETLSEEDQKNKIVSASFAALSLAEGAQNAGELAPLRDKVNANPDDLDTRFELAKALIGRGDYNEGGDQLIELIKRDQEWNEAAARKELLKMFTVIGPMHDITKEFRRKLSTLLFS
ncbi:MAG: thioredoxin [Sneathiella sp.]